LYKYLGKPYDEVVIQIPTNITAEVEYSGNCTSERGTMDLDVESPTKGCNVIRIKVSKYTIDFNITCEDKNDVYNATIECHSAIAIIGVNITGKIICCFFIIAIATIILNSYP